MLLALTWSLVAVLLALWSVAAWALHSISEWTLASTGGLAGGPGWIETWQLPDWLAPWLPAEAPLLLSALQTQLAPFAEFVLLQAPALGGGLSTAIWIVWGIGTVLLLLAGLAGSAAVVLLRSGKLPWKR